MQVAEQKPLAGDAASIRPPRVRRLCRFVQVITRRVAAHIRQRHPRVRGATGAVARYAGRLPKAHRAENGSP